MKFEPKSEKEIAESGLLPKDTYSFEIVDAEDTVSKNKNEMIALKLHVFNRQGEAVIVFDYLVPSMERKLRNAAVACGVLDRYESGELSAFDFKGMTGQAKIVIKKDKNGQYPDRNVVADYVTRTAYAAEPGPAGDLDDEIMF